MNFKEKIVAHNNGTYDLKEELIDLALSDTFKTTMKMTVHKQPYMDYTDPDAELQILHLPRWRPDYSKGQSAEERLARNFKIMIARFTKKANGIRTKRMFEGTQEQLMNIKQDPLHIIYSKMTEYGHHYHKDDFHKVPESFWKHLEEVEGYCPMMKVKDEFKEFLDILPAINRQKKKLQDQYVPVIEEVLDGVLAKVDVSKTEDEIIGFIAKGVRWRTDRAITKKLKTKVHHIEGKEYYVTLEKIRKNGFVRTTANSILQINVNELTASQHVFFDMLCSKINKEIKELNIEPFRFDEEGVPIGINQRYFADKLGMKHDTFRQKLRRLA